MILFLGKIKNLHKNSTSYDFKQYFKELYLSPRNHEPIFMLMVQTQNYFLSHSYSLLLRTPYPIPIPANSSSPVPRGASAG